MTAVRPTGGLGELGISPPPPRPSEGSLMPGLSAAVARALISYRPPRPRRLAPLLVIPLPRQGITPHRTPDLLDLYLERRKAYTRPEVKEDLRFEQFAAPR